MAIPGGVHGFGSRPPTRKQAPRRPHPGYGVSPLRRAAMQKRRSADAMCEARTVIWRGIDAASSASEPDSLRQHVALRLQPTFAQAA